MRYQTLGDKPNFISMRVRNDSGATMPAGSVAIWTLDDTEDMLAVIRPQDSEPKTYGFAAGILMDTLTANQVGEVMVYGKVESAVIYRTSRSHSTVSMSSGDTLTSGILLEIETLANGLSSAAGTVAKTEWLPYAILIDELASIDGYTSTTNNSKLNLTSAGKVFVRML